MTEAEQNRLVIEHMDLVPAIAAEFRGGSVEFDDLCGAGREGLVKAAKSFDPALSKFTTWASTKIRSEMLHALRTGPSEWYPKDDTPPPLDGDKIEKIHEWDAWGEIGNAMAVSETWARLSTSPEDLSLLYDDIRGKQDKFAAAFISLTGAQRKLVKWVFLTDPAMSIPQAARELGVSRFRAGRMLNSALKTMREVIVRMESNRNSEGGTAKRRASRLTSLQGAALGTNAA